jgi:hypothetical protein
MISNVKRIYTLPESTSSWTIHDAETGEIIAYTRHDYSGLIAEDLVKRFNAYYEINEDISQGL